MITGSGGRIARVEHIGPELLMLAGAALADGDEAIDGALDGARQLRGGSANLLASQRAVAIVEETLNLVAGTKWT